MWVGLVDNSAEFDVTERSPLHLELGVDSGKLENVEQQTRYVQHLVAQAEVGQHLGIVTELVNLGVVQQEAGIVEHSPVTLEVVQDLGLDSEPVNRHFVLQLAGFAGNRWVQLEVVEFGVQIQGVGHDSLQCQER